MKHKKLEKVVGEDRSGSFKDFPERLEIVRKKKGMTLREFGETIGVPTSTLWNWENGTRQMPYDLIWLVLCELNMLKN